MSDVVLNARAAVIEENYSKLGTSLCATCGWATVFFSPKRGLRVFCKDIRKFVPPDIEDCSRHNAIGSMCLNDMEAIAQKIDARVGVNAKSYV